MTDRPPLEHFLGLWFGVRQFEGVDPAKAVAPVMRFNHPVSETFDNDVQVLVMEQQGVWQWGQTAEGRFVERENEPDVRWRVIGENADEFWLHHAAFEAVTDLPASRSAQLFDEATIARIKREVAPLPCGTWTWPGTTQTMHYRDASVVMICEDAGDYWVVASAPQEADLDWLDELNLTWDESDTRLTSES
ncbi:hypothetical protein [Nostocoides sp. Soil756]|uniref:hypothetical protein n=1 Tax=Nostocoides sp. Soil756 TaxID=1736399 RepID=UPI0012FA3B06|nr:hypothetical protein [Tetrasphaera sp. Soil756]